MPVVTVATRAIVAIPMAIVAIPIAIVEKTKTERNSRVGIKIRIWLVIIWIGRHHIARRRSDTHSQVPAVDQPMRPPHSVWHQFPLRARTVTGVPFGIDPKTAPCGLSRKLTVALVNAFAASTVTGTPAASIIVTTATIALTCMRMCTSKFDLLRTLGLDVRQTN
jgi:hypothetical protein